MTFYSGKDGQLFIDTVQAAKVQSWSFSSSQAVLETTSLEDTDRTVIAGIRSYSGSARLFYYQTAEGVSGSVTTLIQKCIKAKSSSAAGSEGKAPDSSQATLTLKIKDGTSFRLISFVVFITSLSMTSSVGEVLSADISWEADGAPTDVDI